RPPRARRGRLPPLQRWAQPCPDLRDRVRAPPPRALARGGRRIREAPPELRPVRACPRAVLRPDRLTHRRILHFFLLVGGVAVVRHRTRGGPCERSPRSCSSSGPPPRHAPSVSSLRSAHCRRTPRRRVCRASRRSRSITPAWHRSAPTSRRRSTS